MAEVVLAIGALAGVVWAFSSAASNEDAENLKKKQAEDIANLQRMLKTKDGDVRRALFDGELKGATTAALSDLCPKNAAQAALKILEVVFENEESLDACEEFLQANYKIGLREILRGRKKRSAADALYNTDSYDDNSLESDDDGVHSADSSARKRQRTALYY